MISVGTMLKVRIVVLVLGATIIFAPVSTAATDGTDCTAPSAMSVPAGCGGGAATVSPAAPTTPGFLGDVAWYKKNYPTPTDVKTAPLPTLSFTTIGPNSLALFALSFNPAATTLYAADNTGRTLGTIDLGTGAYTAIGPLTGLAASQTVTGLAFDPTAAPPNNAYFSSTDAVNAMLWNIDVGTGALTNGKVIVGHPLTIDIAIDSTGQMYGHDIGADVLFLIDKTNGNTTLIGPTGLAANFAQGMMFDRSDNTLYGCAFVSSPALGGMLVRFDKATGAATILQNTAEELECSVKLAGGLSAAALAVDAAGNRVMDPNEISTTAPSWLNGAAGTATGVTGTLSNFVGPAGGTYILIDGTGSYGDISGGTTATCTDCYSLFATATTRPLMHWDAAVDENLSVASLKKTWTLHIGGSFTDVATTSPFYRFIETLLHNGVTAGCGVNIYCPASSSTRAQMAVFALVSKEGAGYTPPACVPPNLFADVPESSPFCRYIEELANRGVVTGCGGNMYCPTGPVTRAQMSVFTLRTLDPALNPPACVAGSEIFNDVPASSTFCRWIEELARRGIVAGCGGGRYCPSAPVTREQMSVFLAATFGLSLYRP